MRDKLKRRIFADKVFGVFIVVSAAILISPVFYILYLILFKGFTFLQAALSREFPKLSAALGTALLDAIFSTAATVFAGAAAAFAISLFAGLRAARKNGAFNKILDFSIEALGSIPPIIAGMFVFFVFIGAGGEFSLACGSIAIALFMIPELTRFARDVFRNMPKKIYEAARSLGANDDLIASKILIPAIAKKMVGKTLYLASVAAGLTAPLLFTVKGSSAIWDYPNRNDDENTLSLIIYNFRAVPEEEIRALTWIAALFLLLFILVLLTSSRLISEND